GRPSEIRVQQGRLKASVYKGRDVVETLAVVAETQMPRWPFLLRHVHPVISAHLAKIRAAANDLALLAGHSHLREYHRKQKGNDGDHHQQLNERDSEAGAGAGLGNAGKLGG